MKLKLEVEPDEDAANGLDAGVGKKAHAHGAEGRKRPALPKMRCSSLLR